MNKKVIIEIFESGPQRLMGKGLKYLSIENAGDFVFGNGRVLGFFYGDFEQFNDYAFGGKRLLNKYKFYLEDGTPLTDNLYEEWMLEDAEEIKEEYRNKLDGSSDVLVAKDAEDKKWYFLFPDRERVEETEVWNE